MKEKTLLRIAFICSTAGILLLFLVADNIKLDETQISKITQDDIDKEVLVTGKVTKIFDKNSTMILDISRYETMPVFIFKEEAIQISEGDLVEVRGMVQEYKGEVEIIGNEVRVVG